MIKHRNIYLLSHKAKFHKINLSQIKFISQSLRDSTWKLNGEEKECFEEWK